MLAAAYRHLRRLENRLQMLRDAQVHALPDDANDRARIAAGLGYPDWHALGIELDAVRGQVATEFDALLAPRERKPDAGALTARSEEHTCELQSLMRKSYAGVCMKKKKKQKSIKVKANNQNDRTLKN